MDAHATLLALAQLSRLRARILCEADLSPAERCAVAHQATIHDLETIYGSIMQKESGRHAVAEN